jgi:hypothetical protein
MRRVVVAADGREWVVRTRMTWTSPATSDDFEHDVAGGYTPVVVMAGLLVLLVVVLIAWTPAAVVVPSWLILILVLMLAVLPARWALRRPWDLVAETEEDEEGRPPERWVGAVRGPIAVRNEASRVRRSIETTSLPHIDGALQPMD